jgi:hypothetical protein
VDYETKTWSCVHSLAFWRIKALYGISRWSGLRQKKENGPNAAAEEKSYLNGLFLLFQFKHTRADWLRIYHVHLTIWLITAIPKCVSFTAVSVTISTAEFKLVDYNHDDHVTSRLCGDELKVDICNACLTSGCLHSSCHILMGSIPMMRRLWRKNGERSSGRSLLVSWSDIMGQIAQNLVVGTKKSGTG